jgi:putative transposase
LAVNHKRVLRLMREDNLLCLRKRAFVPVTTHSRHGWRVVPNLARGMVATGLDQLWVADITYIRLQEEFAFLAIVLDAFSRRVIGWALETHLQASLAIAALTMALAALLRDNLDENGCGSGECEAAAGSEEMIVWMIALGKDFVVAAF